MENTTVNLTEHLSEIMNIEELVVDILSEDMSIPEDKMTELFRESDTGKKLFNIKSDYYKVGWENVYHDFAAEASGAIAEIIKAREAAKDAAEEIPTEEVQSEDKLIEGTATPSTKIRTLSLGNKLRKLFESARNDTE